MKRYALAAAVLFIALMLGPAHGLCQGTKVAVFPLKNNGHKQYSGLSSGLAAMMTTNLNSSGSLDAADPSRVENALRKARLNAGAPMLEDALAAAKFLEAEYAVTGEFVVFGSKFRVDVRVHDVATGELKASAKAQAKEDDFFEMVDELSNKVVLAITGSLPEVGGALSVTSEPPGATVTLDGEAVGTTPLSLPDVGKGRHEVILELEGYRPHTEIAAVNERQTTEVKVKLVRLYGGVRVWWKGLPESGVSIGDLVVRVSQFTPQIVYEVAGKYCQNLPAGTYTVSARMAHRSEDQWDSAKSWRTYTAEAQIEPGEVVDIYLRNDLYSPGIEVSTCSGCAAAWDFNTDLVWYEMQ